MINPDFNSISRDIVNILYNIPGYFKPILFMMGTIFLTLGFKAYEYLIKLPGAIIFCIVSAMYGHEIGGFILAILFGAIGLVLGGAIAWFFHQLAIWLTGALVGVLLSLLVYAGLIHSPPSPLVVISSGIFCGSFLILIFEASIVLWTSLIGALLIQISTNLLDSLWLFVLLFLFGVAVQEGVQPKLDVIKNRDNLSIERNSIHHNSSEIYTRLALKKNIKKQLGFAKKLIRSGDYEKANKIIADVLNLENDNKQAIKIKKVVNFYQNGV